MCLGFSFINDLELNKLFQFTNFIDIQAYWKTITDEPIKGPGISLAKLVEKVLGQKLCKSE